MGFKNFFSKDTQEEKFDKEVKHLEESTSVSHWENFLALASEKKTIFDSIEVNDKLHEELRELIELMDLQIKDVLELEHVDDDIVKDLKDISEAIEGKKKQKGMKAMFEFSEVKYHYLNEKFKHINSIIKAQRTLILDIIEGNMPPKTALDKLSAQIMLEVDEINKIEEIHASHDFVFGNN